MIDVRFDFRARETPVDNGDSHLQDPMGAQRRPTRLPPLVHARVDRLFTIDLAPGVAIQRPAWYRRP